MDNQLITHSYERNGLNYLLSVSVSVSHPFFLALANVVHAHCIVTCRSFVPLQLDFDSAFSRWDNIITTTIHLLLFY